MKKKLLRTILICIVLIFIGLSFLSNRSIISVKLYELSQKLNSVNVKSKGGGSIDILYKYELNRKLYLGRLSDSEADYEEMKYAAVISDIDYGKAQIKKEALFALPLVNMLRFALGKPATVYLKEVDNEKYDLAYYHETNNNFKQAAKLYDAILMKHPTEDSVRLHSGYCHALAGDNDRAVEMLNSIIEANRDHDLAFTAAALLMHIRDFVDETEKVLNSNEEELGKSIKLLHLTSYEKAFELLNSIEFTDEKISANINYYKARYYEETGDKEKAVEMYQEIIKNDYTNEFAAKANRRILFVSVNHQNGEELQKLSHSNNDLIADKTYDEMSQVSLVINNDKKKKKQPVSSDFLEKIKEFTKDSQETVEALKHVEKNILKNGNYSLSYFTKAGDLRKLENYDRRGRLMGYYLYVYNNKGERIRIDAYDKDGKRLEYY